MLRAITNPVPRLLQVLNVASLLKGLTVQWPHLPAQSSSHHIWSNMGTSEETGGWGVA